MTLFYVSHLSHTHTLSYFLYSQSLFLTPPLLSVSLSIDVFYVVYQVIQFALRDYIQYWYYTLSDDETFLLEIRQTLQNALVQFSTR